MLKPALPSYTIYSDCLWPSSPDILWASPPPQASRVSAIHVFLVCKQFVSGLYGRQFLSYLPKCFTHLWRALFWDAILGLILISILQNDIDTLWFIHKVILYKGRNCIEYQYWLGLSPENSCVGDGLQILRSGFDSYSHPIFCLKNWRDLDFHEHFSSRNFKRQKFHVG